MGCCNSTEARVLKTSASTLKHQTSDIAKLGEADKICTFEKVQEISMQNRVLRNTLENISFEEQNTCVTVKLIGAKKLANLDFNLVDTLTAGVASKLAGQDLSDPYALLAVGEAGLAWCERQHCGPVVRSKVISDNLNPVWNETLRIRAANDIQNPELHVVLYDYDAALPGNILSVEDDFLGEVRIPLPYKEKNVKVDKENKDGFHNVVDAPLIGELAEREGSTITLSWRRDRLEESDTAKSPDETGNSIDKYPQESNKVTYMITATTWSDSYVPAHTDQPIYAMVVGNKGSTPLVCLQNESEQVMWTNADSYYELSYEDIGTPLYIAVQLKHSKPHHSWGLAKFTISRYGRSWHFPFYSWLYSGKPAAVIFEGKSMTPAEMHKVESVQTVQDYSQQNQLQIETHQLKTRKSACFSSLDNMRKSGINLLSKEQVEEAAQRASDLDKAFLTPAKVKRRLNRKVSMSNSPIGGGVHSTFNTDRPSSNLGNSSSDLRDSEVFVVNEDTIELMLENSPENSTSEASNQGPSTVASDATTTTASEGQTALNNLSDAAVDDDTQAESADDGKIISSVHSAYFQRQVSSEGGEVEMADDGAPHTEEYKSAVKAMKEHTQYDDTVWNMYNVLGHDDEEAMGVRLSGIHTHAISRSEEDGDHDRELSEGARDSRLGATFKTHDPTSSAYDPEKTISQPAAVAPLNAPAAERYMKLMEVRKLEVETHKQEYPWARDLYAAEGSDWRVFPGQIAATGKYGPIHSKNLPVTERFANDKQSDYFWIGVRGIANCYLSRFVGKLHPFSHFDDVLSLFRNIPFPSVIKRWKKDEEFARQWLQGYDPVQIRQWPNKGSDEDISLRKKFPCFNDKILGWPEGKFEKQLAKGKLFYLDFEKLHGMECWDDLPPKKFNQNGKRPRFCAAALCLFSVEKYYDVVEPDAKKPDGSSADAKGDSIEAIDKNSERRGILMPIAIQLGQDPKLPLFTRDGTATGTSELDWLLAKMYVQNSGANLHQIISHAMKTHLITEPFVISAERNLSHVHPLWKLIKRHTRYTLAINTKARNGLIDAGGIFDEFISCGGGGHMKLCAREYSQWNLLHNNLRKNLKDRGCLDEEALPYYPYRDDGLLVWDAMEAYVREVVNMHYQSDADVGEDSELAAFADDIAVNGHTRSQFQPEWLKTREGAIEVFTILIWTVSCQHSSVNFGQYKYLGFPLNAPMSMYKDPLSIRPGQFKTESQIMHEVMPTQHQICRQIAVAYMLGA